MVRFWVYLEVKANELCRQNGSGVITPVFLVSGTGRRRLSFAEMRNTAAVQGWEWGEVKGPVLDVGIPEH